MWVGAVLIGGVILLGGVFSAIIGGITLIEKLRGTAKVQATTKQSDDGPGRVEFDLHIDTLKDNMEELKAGQKEMLLKLETWGGKQYEARGRMHRKMNTLENAMHFWAGKLAGQGDPDAKRLVSILDQNKAEEEEA